MRVLIYIRIVGRVNLTSVERGFMTEIIQMNDNVCTVSTVLEKSANLTRVLVLGLDKNDDLFFGVSGMDIPEMLYHMEKCKHLLMTMED